MTEHEKLMIMIAHAMARQENDLQYLKALLMEKLNLPIEKLQQEQEAFWKKTKNFRVHETLKNLQTLQQDMEALPEGLTLDIYLDHLRWPSDPPQEGQKG